MPLGKGGVDSAPAITDPLAHAWRPAGQAPPVAGILRLAGSHRCQARRAERVAEQARLRRQGAHLYLSLHTFEQHDVVVHFPDPVGAGAKEGPDSPCLLLPWCGTRLLDRPPRCDGRPPALTLSLSLEPSSQV
jgi:hypothetical protein